MRSLLHLRAGDADGLGSALTAGADALVIELGEGTPGHAIRDFLRATNLLTHRPLLFVRLPSISADAVDEDLAAIMVGEPDGIVLGRCRGGQEVQHLSVKLAVQEAEYGLADGETPIIAEAGSTARSLFALESYCDASDRLMGLVWDQSGLVADLGADDPGIADRAPVTTARGLALLAARAADVTAIEGASSTTDEAAFRDECERARRDGFNAKIGISPAQIAIINAVFDREG